MSDKDKEDVPPLEATGASSIETLRAEKERYKETHYMSLYKDLLRKHRGLFQEHRDAENQAEFAEEAALLKEAISSQRQALAAGIGVGLLTFVSLHYLPTYLIRHLGGEAKVKALGLAEQQAKQDGTAWVRKTTGFTLEGLFSIWTGYNACHRAAEYSEDTYEMIAKVPLSSGRSAVAEALCDEWIQTTRHHIPDMFWRSERDGTLRDVKAWKAIRQFSDNCVRRQQYEAYLRQKRGISDSEPISLPRKVPECSDSYKSEISRKEAEKLAEDRK